MTLTAVTTTTETSYVQFADSASPESIPDGEFTHACYYADGLFAWPRSEILRFKFRHAITVTGEASCGIADFEPGNAVYEQPGALHRWARNRELRRLPARVYLDRNDARRAIEELAGQDVLWWIATLDNKRWTPDELSANLKDQFGVSIVPASIWGNQYAGGESAPYDTSDLFLGWW
jgi:hypothetical protein